MCGKPLACLQSGAPKKTKSKSKSKFNWLRQKMYDAPFDNRCEEIDVYSDNTDASEI